MANCTFKVNVNDDIIEFDNENSLKQFIQDNYFKFKSLETLNDISFSKNLDIFSESQAKIESILSENKSLEYKIDEYGEQYISATGFTGVNRYIEESYSESGKQLTSRFDEDQFIKNNLSKEIAILKSDPGFKGMTEEDLKSFAIDNIQGYLKQFKQLGKFGTELHYVSELFFKHGYTGIEDIYENMKIKYPESNFNKDVIEKMLNYIKDFSNDIYNQYGEDAKIYTEFPIHDSETKIVGIIDVLVLDNKGHTHIYDYKASHKKAGEWGAAKMNKMKYQMAFYKQLLLKKGLITTSVSLLPIDLSNVDYDMNTISDIDSSQPEMILTQELNRSFYQYEANRAIPIRTNNFLSEQISNNIIKDELMSSFGYSIQTNPDVNTFKIKTNPKGEKYFWDSLSGKKEILDGTDEENQEKIDKYKRLYAASENHEILSIKDDVKRYMKDPSVLKNIKGGEQARSYFETLFRPYKDFEWEMVEDDNLDALGIIAFQNNITKTIDFISLTSNKLGSLVNFNKGTTILGNFYDDRFLYKEGDLLKATTYNVEGLKIAMWINSNKELFDKFDFNIGEMRVATTNLFDIQGLNSKEIISNYYRLTKESKVTFNLQDVKFVNPYNLLLSKITTIIEDPDRMDSYGKSKNVISQIDEILGRTDNEIQSYSNLSPSEISHKIDLLNQISNQIKSVSDVDKMDMNNDMHYLYMLAQQAIAHFEGYEVAYIDDLKEWNLNESSRASSIQNISNKVVKMVFDVYNRAKNNIGSNFNVFNDKINKTILEYFDNIGFNRTEQMIVGKAKNVYIDLFEASSGNKLDPDFRLKDPYNDNTLTKAQKTFLKSYLEQLNSLKYNNQDEINNAKATGDYFKLPLIKARGVQRLIQKGVINTSKTSLLNSIDFNNFFEDQTEENRKHAKAMDQMYNPFNSQDVENKRQQMLEEFGTDEFEQDLQTIIKTYALSHIKEEEFNKVLPIINAIRTTAKFKNNGLAKKITDHLDSFIEDYVKVVIFNEKLIEPEHEKFIRVASSAKEITSIALIAFNFAGGVRDTFQGIFTNIVNSASKAYGYKIETKALLQAYKFLTENAVSQVKVANLIDSMNKKYMVSMMDTNMLAERSSIGQNGLLTFRSEQMYFANAIPDFGNRMSLFIAKMIQDGTLDAHSEKDGQLIYDWKLDKRFNIYSKGLKSNHEYDQQRGLYLTLLNEFNKQKLTPEPLVEGNALPQAYTYNDIESLKQFSNLIHGYYDQDSKMLMQATWFGTVFIQFKNWLRAKIDQMFLARNNYKVGERKQATQYGQLQWLKTDENGTIYITSENTGVPYYPMEFSIMEGCLVSFKRLVQNVYKSKGNIKEVMQLLNQDDLMKGNLKKVSGDLAIFSIITALVASIDWPEFKEDSPYLSRFTYTVGKASDDLFIGNNISAAINPQSLFPSVSYLWKSASVIPIFFSSPSQGARQLMNQTGAFRVLSPIIPENQ